MTVKNKIILYMLKVVGRYFLVLSLGCFVLVVTQKLGLAADGFSEEEFPRNFYLNDKSLEIRGLGLKKFFFMRAFTAALYMDPGVSHDDYFESDESSHLEVHYFVPISAKQLSKFTVLHMRNNLSREAFLRLESDVRLMEKYFVDLEPGDRFALTYVPGEGTRFSHNGELTGVIPGVDFGRAVFSVWFGQEPFDRKLKKQLLGLAAWQGHQKEFSLQLAIRMGGNDERA